MNLKTSIEYSSQARNYATIIWRLPKLRQNMSKPRSTRLVTRVSNCLRLCFLGLQFVEVHRASVQSPAVGKAANLRWKPHTVICNAILKDWLGDAWSIGSKSHWKSPDFCSD